MMLMYFLTIKTKYFMQHCIRHLYSCQCIPQADFFSNDIAMDVIVDLIYASFCLKHAAQKLKNFSNASSA